MTGTSDLGATLGPYRLILSVAIVGIALALRNRQARPLRLGRLWLRPMISIIGVAAVLIALPPPLTPFSLAIMAMGIGVGGAVGWQRGRFIRLEVHPETRAVMARMSSVGMVFVLAFIGLRSMLPTNTGGTPLAGVPAATITDSLMLLAGAMMVAQQVELTLRARRLLAEAGPIPVIDAP